MSASEKLQALELRDREGQFALLSVRDAIVTVVEAAEDAADHFIDQSAHDHGWPIELKKALAALEEALTKSVRASEETKP